MWVELDVFSGRPNPRWELTAGEAAEVRRLIGGLTGAPEGPRPEPPGLGYRGFTLEDPSGGTTRVFRGYVQTSGGVLGDPQRSLERLLLKLLPESLKDLRARLESQLE